MFMISVTSIHVPVDNAFLHTTYVTDQKTATTDPMRPHLHAKTSSNFIFVQPIVLFLAILYLQGMHTLLANFHKLQLIIGYWVVLIHNPNKSTDEIVKLNE